VPFTPFHLGFGLFMLAILPFLDPISLLLGTIIIDLEGIFCWIFTFCPMHGVLHSLVGVISFFLPLSFFSWLCYKKFKLEKFFFFPKFNWILSLTSGVLGLFSHIFFDAIMYPEIKLFFPFSDKTGILYGLIPSWVIYVLLSCMFLIGILIIIAKYLVKNKKRQNVSTSLKK